MASTVEPIVCTDHNWLPDSNCHGCPAQASLTAVSFVFGRKGQKGMDTSKKEEIQGQHSFLM